MSIQIVTMSGDHKFEVYLEGRPVGMVWKANAAWYADEISMARPAVCEASKDAAIQSLLTCVAGRNAAPRL
jgi:hypothetical protein